MPIILWPIFTRLFDGSAALLVDPVIPGPDQTWVIHVEPAYRVISQVA